MARKFLYFVAFCILVFIAGRLALTFYPEQLTRWSFTPSGKFEAQPDLAASAYGNPDLWFARPDMTGENPARWLPQGAAPAAPVNAAVFFVHPTSYLKKSHWNGPLDDPDARRIGTVLVRANAQFNITPVEDPKPYQDFFNSLSKSLFLQAQNVD